MEKRKEKIVKKIIKFNHDNSTFYKFDKCLKITKVKINKLELIEPIEEGNVYKVSYKYGLNKWNPFAWIIVIIPSFLICMYEGIKEILEELQSFKMDNYSDTIKIKDLL
ncbi:hypothetical protein EXN48_14560 [Clostridium botulinum]|uniref:hypothetical protein n=1 Tax=Clostridium botulinum TaxID=1491 RepID=UPI000C76336F|nr:hypothetical protein [Clostridium botulinum]AUN20000.1 hypothetical protein RSJ22_00450 [Clostridium botulinum]MCR1167309.1 hypothetical protein [Clostridium botulinum]NFC67287.1 hypothetical protein [Clostridium botulinum]NFC90741.1 hypothetical protein [Clostridium botulinum]NFC99626.1 hypothetical protein [Clostridium botulinum]